MRFRSCKKWSKLLNFKVKITINVVYTCTSKDTGAAHAKISFKKYVHLDQNLFSVNGR